MPRRCCGWPTEASSFVTAVVRSATSRRRGPPSRPGRCERHCSWRRGGRTTGSKGCRSSLARSSRCAPPGACWRGSTCAAFSEPPARGPGSPATSATLRGPSCASATRESGDESTASWPRSRISRSRPRRADGRRSCCSGTTTTISSGSAGRPTPGCSRRARCVSSFAPAGSRALGARDRSVVAAPEQRPVATKPAHRRRPLLPYWPRSRPTTRAMSAIFPTTGWYLQGRYEHGTSDDVSPVALPEVVPPADPGGRRLRLRPAVARPAPLLAPHPVASGQRTAARRWLARAVTAFRCSGVSRSAGLTCCRDTTSAPLPARRADSATRRTPALCDRMIAAQVEVRTRLGLNLGYRMRGKEAGSNGRFIGIEEADLVFLGDVGKAWLAGDGPGQVPAGRIPSLRRMEGGRRRRARRW